MIALCGIIIGLCILMAYFRKAANRRQPTLKEYISYENERIKNAALRRNNR